MLRQGGQPVAVIGSHYPGLAPSSAVRLSAAQARGIAEQEVGAGGQWFVTLMIDPQSGRCFYRVEQRGFDSRWFFWIDADNGRQLNRYDGLETGTGIGVKGDTKTVDSTFDGTVYVMLSPDNRRISYDARQAQTQQRFPGMLFADSDDTWDTPGRTSPGHPAGVDAHYYAEVADDFYGDTFGRDSLDDNGRQIVSSVHVSRNYNNAFWTGSQAAYGDGDGTDTFRELSGGLDVVGHELTHGVTQFSSNLIYQDESGALNEAFSTHRQKTPRRPRWTISTGLVISRSAPYTLIRHVTG